LTNKNTSANTITETRLTSTDMLSIIRRLRSTSTERNLFRGSKLNCTLAIA
jgi:hypothetical protein